ncbi:hypothetical protein HPB47_010444, partial [Ixodes persulcatus]
TPSACRSGFLVLLVGAALAEDKDSFSIGLGVLSPSYSQKIGVDGSTKVDFNQEKSGFSYSVSSGNPAEKGSAGSPTKPYSHISFSQQFQEPRSKGAGELQQVAQHQAPPSQASYGQGSPEAAKVQYVPQGYAPGPQAAPQYAGYGGTSGPYSLSGGAQHGAPQQAAGYGYSPSVFSGGNSLAAYGGSPGGPQGGYGAPQQAAYGSPQGHQGFAAENAAALAAAQQQAYSQQQQAYAPQQQALQQSYAPPQQAYAPQQQPSFAPPQHLLPRPLQWSRRCRRRRRRRWRSIPRCGTRCRSDTVPTSSAQPKPSCLKVQQFTVVAQERHLPFMEATAVVVPVPEPEVLTATVAAPVLPEQPFKRTAVAREPRLRFMAVTVAPEPAEPAQVFTLTLAEPLLELLFTAMAAVVAQLVPPFWDTVAAPEPGWHFTVVMVATEQLPECSTLPEHLLAGHKPVDTLRSLQPSGPVDTERREATEHTEHMEEPTEEPKEPVATLPRRRCRSSRPTTHKVNHREHISISEPRLRARSATAVLAPGPLTASIYLSLALRVTPVFLGEAIDGSAGRNNSDPIVACSR